MPRWALRLPACIAQQGVDLRCGVQIVAIEGTDGRVTGVRLADGSVVESDVVVVGIGVAPATEWLADSGLELRDGIVCDDTLWTGAPGVYAAGDCARWPNRVFDGHDDVEMRVEHWTNAAEQGAAAARSLLATAAGLPAPAYESVPFFWSDQFDRRIQFVGRAHGGDDVHVFAGELDGPFAALYGYQGSPAWRARRQHAPQGDALPRPHRRQSQLGRSPRPRRNPVVTTNRQPCSGGRGARRPCPSEPEAVWSSGPLTTKTVVSVAGSAIPPERWSSWDTLAPDPGERAHLGLQSMVRRRSRAWLDLIGRVGGEWNRVATLRGLGTGCQ